MKHLLHGIVTAGILFFTILLPLWRAQTAEDTDAVSSASVVIDQPSGEYLVFLNRSLHEDSGTLTQWEAFFRGEEIGILFEDLSCSVADGDTAALAMAESFQSRLPENQMKLRTEDGILLLSKAEYGSFDVLIFSKEAADTYQAETLCEKDFVSVIAVTGGS